MEAHVCPLPLGERVEAVDDDDEVALILHLGCEQTHIQETEARPLKEERRKIFLTRNVPPCFRSLLVDLQRDGKARKRKLFNRGNDGNSKVLKTFQRRKKAEKATAPPPAENPSPASSIKAIRYDRTPPPSSSCSRLRTGGFTYRKAWVFDLPILKERRALDLLSRMGLERFAREPVPDLDKPLCDEFLATFDVKAASGIVQGKVVVVDAASVAEATGLPLGDDEITLGAPSKAQELALRKVMTDAKEKRTRGYSIQHLAFGDHVQEMQAIATMLMAKLECKNDSYHLLSAEMVLALDKSYRMGVKMRWAEFLARMIVRATATIAITKSKGRRLAFEYGEWLTKIIRSKLGESDEPRGTMTLSRVCVEQGRTSEEKQGTSEEQREQQGTNEEPGRTSEEVERDQETLEANKNGDAQILEVKENGDIRNEDLEAHSQEQAMEIEVQDVNTRKEPEEDGSNAGKMVTEDGASGDNRNEELENLEAHSQEQAMEIEVQPPQEDVNTREELEGDGSNAGKMLTEERDAGARLSVEKQDAGVQTMTSGDDLVTQQRLEIRRLRAELREILRRDTEARKMISSMKTAYVKFKQELAELRAKTTLPEPTNE
ncbi:uncharacterized protein LOC112341933 [Selaginella moellendorffii]|uniref:uncharacterized protein LOC112341933 n=1 Tax=Selaginella moellendorffii TaxID=88036 RepID=UPI000D1CCFD8|nr:uncharacterized protein LOC112341933 [Selaginella moellendorffii]|eukprot:XP_024518732.1 uncharacterized protein LOC112341933 [Selaginella moellendorffii]